MSNKKELETILVTKFEEGVHTMLSAFLSDAFEEAGMDIKAFGEFLLSQTRDRMVEVVDKVFTEEDAAVFIDYNTKLAPKVEEFNKLYSDSITEITETLETKVDEWVEQNMKTDNQPQTVVH